MTNKQAITLHVNNEIRTIHARPADTLLCVLREQLGLTGAKPACENGDCDACTVLVDGTPMKSCLLLGIEATQAEITTVEGLKNTPIQTAFIEKNAFQCGYCTSGFLMNSHALTTLHPEASDEQIDEWLASNLCRCTSYQEIKQAVKAVLSGEVT